MLVANRDNHPTYQAPLGVAPLGLWGKTMWSCFSTNIPLLTELKRCVTSVIELFR